MIKSLIGYSPAVNVTITTTPYMVLQELVAATVDRMLNK